MIPFKDAYIVEYSKEKMQRVQMDEIIYEKHEAEKRMSDLIGQGYYYVDISPIEYYHNDLRGTYY